MTNFIDFKAIERYFSGKARDEARAAIILLNQSLAEQRWVKGASRRVRAALSKQAPVRKWVSSQERPWEERRANEDQPKELEGRLGDVMELRRTYWEGPRLGDTILSRLGAPSHAPSVDDLCRSEAARRLPRTQSERDGIEYAREWAAAFLPVAEAMAYLDALRPAPVFVIGGTISATVAKTLTELGLDPTTIKMPEFKVRHVVRMRDGKTVTEAVIDIIWPENTVHGMAKFSTSRAGNSQCHACGHAIKNCFNWVPLAIRHRDGKRWFSMWIGRDCAWNLFNIKMEGDAEYAAMDGK